VTLDGYWIDQTEVTNAQYKRCVAAGSCRARRADETSSFTYSSYYGDSTYADYPVIRVDWNQAQAYCEWAGGRLPTEAEWEKAARGTDGRMYPWGDGPLTGARANFFDAYCDSWADCSQDDRYADTAPVGSYPDGASPYGALDMAGNVWEWVADWYDAEYYNRSPGENPTGPSSGYHLVRGGSWMSGSADLRAAYRYLYNADYESGFRCVRSP
jgi:eukaryotic-like serine/threonine-protein kinase